MRTDSIFACVPKGARCVGIANVQQHIAIATLPFYQIQVARASCCTYSTYNAIVLGGGPDALDSGRAVTG